MTDGEVAERSRGREVDRGNAVKTLLNSLTLEQIREAAYLLAPDRRLRIRSHGTSFDDILQTGKPRDEIIRRLLEVEALAPFKHSLVTRCMEPSRIERLSNLVTKTLSPPGFDFLVRFYLATSKHVFVTLEHTVTVREWIESEDGNIKRLDQYETRHPLVLRISLETGILLLSYPGFTQGSGTKRTFLIGYTELTTAVVRALEQLGIQTVPLPIQESLKVLMAGPNRRVHRIRADFESANVGRFDLSSLNERKTVEESLADLMLPHLGGVATRESFIDSAKKAINEAGTNFMLLYWSDEGVMTRLRFWDTGCEIFFTWHGERASYRTVDSIIALLVEAGARSGGPGAADGTPLAWIANLPSNEVVRPSALAEKFQITARQASQELVYAISAGMVSPVYRLNSSEPIEDNLNDWTEELPALKRLWRTQTGRVIDGADPKNVEVAFRRVVSAGGGK